MANDNTTALHYHIQSLNRDSNEWDSFRVVRLEPGQRISDIPITAFGGNVPIRAVPCVDCSTSSGG